MDENGKLTTNDRISLVASRTKNEEIFKHKMYQYLYG